MLHLAISMGWEIIGTCDNCGGNKYRNTETGEIRDMCICQYFNVCDKPEDIRKSCVHLIGKSCCLAKECGVRRGGSDVGCERREI